MAGGSSDLESSDLELSVRALVKPLELFWLEFLARAFG